MLEGNKIKFTSGKTLIIETLDAYKLRINTSDIAFITRRTDESSGDIDSISFEDKFTIKRGDEFPMNVGNLKSVYKVIYILIEDDNKSVILFTALPTKTSTFLLPMLSRSKTFLELDSYFVNAYLDYTYKFMVLVYRYTGSEIYKEFESKMMTDSLCVSHLEHDPKHESDIEYFMDGEYSKFSKALRGRIKKFYGKNSKPIIDVIDRNPVLRLNMEDFLGVKLAVDAELASKPEIETEIYMPYEQRRKERVEERHEGI
jgi:hypothetical protein